MMKRQVGRVLRRQKAALISFFFDFRADFYIVSPNSDRREENVLRAVAAVSDMIWNSGNDDACQSSHDSFVLRQARYRPRRFVSCPGISLEKTDC